MWCRVFIFLCKNKWFRGKLSILKVVLLVKEIISCNCNLMYEILKNWIYVCAIVSFIDWRRGRIDGNISKCFAAEFEVLKFPLALQHRIVSSVKSFNSKQFLCLVWKLKNLTFLTHMSWFDRNLIKGLRSQRHAMSKFKLKKKSGTDTFSVPLSLQTVKTFPLSLISRVVDFI